MKKKKKNWREVKVLTRIFFGSNISAKRDSTTKFTEVLEVCGGGRFYAFFNAF